MFYHISLLVLRDAARAFIALLGIIYLIVLLWLARLLRAASHGAGRLFGKQAPHWLATSLGIVVVVLVVVVALAAAFKGFERLSNNIYGKTNATTAKGIKPIVGVETYVARRSMRDKEGKADSQPFHLVLLAENWEGYQNLCRLITDAHLDGYYYKPRIDHEHLAKYSKGLIGLSACLSGEVAKALEVDDWDLARKTAGTYREIFGKDRFFLAATHHQDKV